MKATEPDVDPGENIFNEQLRRFKFELGEVVTADMAEEFMHSYQRPDNPRIVGAYPDPRSNALFVIGPPEAEQAIRECLAQWIVDKQGGLVGAMSMSLQLRILQQERATLLLNMAELEVQEVAAAAEVNGSQKAKQLADRRKTLDDRLKVAEQQIQVVRKYMARLAEDESQTGKVDGSTAAK